MIGSRGECPCSDQLYAYDELGRKTSMRDDTPTGALRASWTYDTLPIGKGKLTSATRHAGGNEYTTRVDAYDSYGRPTSTSVLCRRRK